MSDRSIPLPPIESAKTFTVPDDLEIEQVLSEPLVAQPVFITFDERGRMWVVEYRQYPAPAGLNVVSRDKFWRAVYDKVPEPPPATRTMRSALDDEAVARNKRKRMARIRNGPLTPALSPSEGERGTGRQAA